MRKSCHENVCRVAAGSRARSEGGRGNIRQHGTASRPPCRGVYRWGRARNTSMRYTSNLHLTAYRYFEATKCFQKFALENETKLTLNAISCSKGSYYLWQKYRSLSSVSNHGEPLGFTPVYAYFERRCRLPLLMLRTLDESTYNADNGAR